MATAHDNTLVCAAVDDDATTVEFVMSERPTGANPLQSSGSSYWLAAPPP